jgi:hypothetical protein
MAPDERDRNFDKALARHLRSAAPAQQASEATSRFAPQGRACPDSETLAAYHERSLHPEELNAWKEHIVGCKNCQMILAQLEETDAIPLPASERDQVPAVSEWRPGPAIASQAVVSISASEGRAEGKSIANTPSPRRIRRLQVLHGTHWRWLAPAGAIAAVLLVWIATHENRSLLPPASQETKIAKNIPATTPPLPERPVLVAPAPSGALPRVQPVPNGAASANSRSESYGLEPQKNHELAPAAKAAPESAYADKVSGLRKDEARGKSDTLRDAESQRDLDAKTAGGVAKETAQLQAQAPAPSSTESPTQLQNQMANQQNQNQVNANVQKVPGPAPLSQAVETKRARIAGAPAPAVPAPPPAADTGATMSYQSSEATAFKKVSGGQLILVPGSRVIWRPGAGGLIEISNDMGASWSRQTSGVLTDLLAGSAVSDKICWMVGRAGTVLVTVDGGAHWKVLNSPLSEGLGGIRATDALHATVWNLGRTKSFQTSDGGMTWQPVPNP